MRRSRYKESVRSRVGLWAALSRAGLVLLALASGATAHEVQPAVADLTISDDSVDITIRLTLEAPLAGVDLEGIADTNEAENSDAYDALRALGPEALATKLSDAWPGLAGRITLQSGDTQLTPELLDADIPETGNTELPRFSTIALRAPLPAGEDPIVFGWDAGMGPLILRQQGVEDGYTAFLQNGDLSDPIPRTGGDDRTAGQIFVTYVLSGFDHIVPQGLDHILFVLGLFFFALAWGPLLWQVTSFTVAHTVSLALATLGIVSIPPEWSWAVEAAIALSITYVAVENVFRPTMGWLRPAIVFGFGLLHGLGFATVLGEFGLPTGQYVLALLAFNLGVEFGQLAVILGAILLLLVARSAADIAHLHDEEQPVRELHVIYRSVSIAASILIAVVGIYWTLERVGFLG